MIGVMESDCELPNIAFPDIYMYLISHPSLYTGEAMKAYKSLDAYKYFTSGKVRDVYVWRQVNTKAGDDFRVDCELCRHWGLSRRTGAKQNCAGGVEERRGRSRFFAGAKQNGAGAKQNGRGEEEGVSWGCCVSRKPTDQNVGRGAKFGQKEYSFASRLLASENAIVKLLLRSETFGSSPFWSHSCRLVRPP
ncbi:hypothetical protein Bbelb_364380 [Branchiostoma belcheri]|nr:hypothetical protein Bbelb_364380 [Branchiostoma belcheri]